MSILNYFFIGFGFTFIVDLLLGMKEIKNHPKMKDKNWGVRERIICIIIWPLSILIFLLAFIRSFFK